MCTKQELSKFLDNIKDDSVFYPELRNYKAYEKLLNDKINNDTANSPLTDLIEELIDKQPGRSKVDLACTLAGLMNRLAYDEKEKEIPKEPTQSSQEREEKILEEARKLIWDDDGSGEQLNKFVNSHPGLSDDVAKRTNCPTIPQRIFPLATFLPKNGSVGVLELGCSRGDLGLALLNLERFLQTEKAGELSPYLFSKPTEEEAEQYRRLCPNEKVGNAYRQFGTSFIKNSASSDIKVFPERSLREILEHSRSIDRYFGVDLLTEEQTQSDWLLALWGLRDPRRKLLARFYDDFKPESENPKVFKRMMGVNALDVKKYESEALEFMSGVDNLVIFTSYMIYQLSIQQRYALVEVVRQIKETFEEEARKNNRSINFYWFNQATSAEKIFTTHELTFKSLYFSELKFDKENKIHVRDLAWLADDCNSNWRQSVISNFLKTIEKDRYLYPELRNYNAYKRLLDDENSSLSKLVRQLVKRQPDRNLKDLAGALAGAMNLLAYQEYGVQHQRGDTIQTSEFYVGKNEDAIGEYNRPKDDKTEHQEAVEFQNLENDILKGAREQFWDDDDSGKKLDEFVKRYHNPLLDIILSHTNCPTIPQRAFPLATFLPEKGSIGVLELGCSHGDLGLALLNPERVLRPENVGEEISPYLFSGKDDGNSTGGNIANRRFGAKCSIKYADLTGYDANKSDIPPRKQGVCPQRSWREILRRSRSIDRYFGVDFQEKKHTEPDWLLALWGVGDPRRKVLERFYRDFKAEESRFFKRTVANVLDVEQYLGDALNFMSGVDNLVLVTSYKVDLLTVSQRFRLVDVVRRIKNSFETRYPGKKFYWFNQGRSVREFFVEECNSKCDDLYFSELNFNEAGRLRGRDLALLADDCNSNWRTPHILVLYGGPSRESLISVKSANTVIDNLNESGFSCSALEIPQDVLDEVGESQVDKKNSYNKESPQANDYTRKLNNADIQAKKEAMGNSKVERELAKYKRANVRVETILTHYYEDKNKDETDIVFPYLHGLYGEDGKLQKILEDWNEKKGLAYVGCNSISSNLGMDKHLSKKIWNAQAPSYAYWIEQENNKCLSTYDWDERLRQNPLWLFERIKIHYNEAKKRWQVFKDESVDFSKASDEEKNAFARRIFGKNSYREISDEEWSAKLCEMFDIMLRRWEYDVFIYGAEWDSKFENPDFSFEEKYDAFKTDTKDDQKQKARMNQILGFLESRTTKEFIVERRYEAPVMTAPWILVDKTNHTFDKCTDKRNGISIKEDDNFETVIGKIKEFNKAQPDQERLQGACVFKPYNEGSSFNVKFINPKDSSPEELANSVADELSELQDDTHEDWILEKRLTGIDVTVSVLGNGDDLVVLPPLQIRPRNEFYDYEAKYFQEDSTYIFKMFPIHPAYVQTMKNIAAKAYRMLGCRDFTRIDLLMVDDEKDPSKKRFYVLEANTLPGATVHSLTPKSALEAGFTLPEFFRYVVDKAFYRYSSNYAMREIPGQDLFKE